MAEAYNSKNPYVSTIIEDTLLNGPGAKKETRHYVFTLPKTGLEYKVGDALGVFPENPPHTVDQLIDLCGWDGDQSIAGPSGEETLRNVIKTQVEIHRVNKKFLNDLSERIQPSNGTINSRIAARVRIPIAAGSSGSGGAGDEWHWSGDSSDWPAGYAPGSAGSDPGQKLAHLVSDGKSMEEYIWSRDYIDVIKEFGLHHSPEEFLSLLDKLKPRLYSIASSLDAHPGEVELTIAIVRYDYHGRKRGGLCTVFIADEAEVGKTPVKIFMSPTKSFVLPKDTSTDIIMVGPGTGIAPFRAFLEQREVDAGSGRNWLFFGDQSQSTEYYYSEQIEAWLENGNLFRYTTAWSRDQAEKIYVQHRMKEYGEEIWQWLSNGAHFYVCGDKNYMAKDVHATLIGIAQEHGGMSNDAAVEYIEKKLMRGEKRYLRDVY